MIHIFALAAHGEGISGGDRIFIEFAKRWSRKVPVELHVWREGARMCQRSGLRSKNNLKINVISIWSFFPNNFALIYLVRILLGIKLGLTVNLKSQDTIYSASEFWMDSFPCWILKIRYKTIKWAAAWYQTAPDPFTGFSESTRERRYKISAFLYYLVQLPIKPLIDRFADYILVNNDEEVRQFSQLKPKERIIVVLGAVDTKRIGEFKKKIGRLSKKYDGVFQGRFHPQKGVVELIEIWKKVIEKKPNATLAMIGDGPLMKDVRQRISELKLTKNILLKGFMFDGLEKYKLFSQSKIVLHPAFYDSGGMAAAEAMAFKIPGIGFNLPSYRSYYPQGMMKVKTGDLDGFANMVLRLLQDRSLYQKVSSDALIMITNNWSWDKRADEILEKIT